MIPRWLSALIAVTMLITIGAGLSLAYLHSPYVIRIERIDAVQHKDQEKPKPEVMPAFGPVPHVEVVAAPPVPVATPTPAPAPRVVKRKPARKKSAKHTLRTNWVAPTVQPDSVTTFSFPRLF